MAAKNAFEGYTAGGEVPALSLIDLTSQISDTVDLVNVIRMIYVGVGGDIKVTDTQGNTVIHKNVPGGSYIGPFRVARIFSTLTTASSLVGYQ
jgi:hypothetical protein